MGFLIEDGELSRLVSEYVVLRDELGLEPEWCSRGELDDSEGGLTDFPYVDADAQAWELLEVGMEVAEVARGKQVWITRDGVGIRVFFGSLEDVKARVRSLMDQLVVHDVQVA